MHVVAVEPVGEQAVNVAGGPEAVKSTSAERVTGVAGAHSELLQTPTHLDVLGTVVAGAEIGRPSSEPQQRRLAHHVPRTATHIALDMKQS